MNPLLASIDQIKNTVLDLTIHFGRSRAARGSCVTLGLKGARAVTYTLAPSSPSRHQVFALQVAAKIDS